MTALPVRFGDRVRNYAAGATLLAGLAFFLFWVHRFYPIQHWLVWRYLTYVLVAGMFLLVCASAGELVVRKIRGASLPLREQLVQSVAVGCFAFVSGWFVLGLFGLMNRASAVLWPLALSAPNLWPLIKRLRRASRLSHRLALPTRQRSWLWYPVFVLGVLALALIYLPLLSPANVAYDSRWYHQALAEHYAADGKIRPFREGWFMGAYPQFATYVYSWAYSLPRTILFDRVELSLHLEFALFVYTLASVPVLVRRLSPHAPISLSWVAVFAFPELFCYDSMLSGAADHVAAAFTIPLFLSLLRALPELKERECAVLGLLCAALLLAKYTVYAAVLVTGSVVLARALWLGVWSLSKPRAQRKAQWLLGPVLLGVVALVGSAPHWLKNLAWYKDPFYPLLDSLFPSTPPITEPAKLGWFVPKEWAAERSLDGVWETLKAAFTFSFVPNDWPSLHRDVPIFGSLFTLSIPCLFFVRRRRRLVLLYVVVHWCVMQWYWSFHQDRYLQAYVPWMAACIAAVAAQLWQLGVFARCGVSALFCAQLIWGGDVPFFPTHSMSGSALKTAIDLLSSGYRGDYVNRLKPYGPWSEFAQHLPKSARVLVHEDHLRLGLGAPAVSDAASWQAGIDYSKAGTPAKVFDRLRELGVTHVMWRVGVSRGFDSVASDVAFYSFILNYTPPERAFFAGYTLARMPNERPADSAPGYTAVLACGKTYANGLYPTAKLNVYPLMTARPASDYPEPAVPLTSLAELNEREEPLDAILFDPSCAPPGSTVPEGFVFAAQRGTDQLYVRQR